MGLAISTHFLADMLANDEEGAEWFRDRLVLVNTLLVENSLPPHVEPETYGVTKARPHTSSFPYSMLHYLRRAYAHAARHPERPLTPVSSGEDPASDPLVDSLMTNFDVHLVCHSDSEGFYVPVAFEEVIFDTEDRGLPGGMLGSTVRLMKELVYVAPFIDIALVDGQLSDRAAAVVHATADDAPFGRERLVWLALFEAARVSLANRTLLVFN
ncbi:MAG: hypothetical protein H0T79_13945 [Deltaproteobacteria bacterium]|nr:hypothetical protein [Deltaproteobacteria bacterium]